MILWRPALRPTSHVSSDATNRAKRLNLDPGTMLALTVAAICAWWVRMSRMLDMNCSSQIEGWFQIARIKEVLSPLRADGCRSLPRHRPSGQHGRPRTCWLIF